MRYWWFHGGGLGVTHGPYMDQDEMYADADLLDVDIDLMEIFSSATSVMPKFTPRGQKTRRSFQSYR